MALIVVERLFDEPAAFDELQKQEDEIGWCLEQNGVTFLRTYFSLDRTRMICIYDAPDAEAVRRTQKQGHLPYSTIYAADTLGLES